MQIELAVQCAKRPFAVYERLQDAAFREAMVAVTGARAIEVQPTEGGLTIRREVETAVPPQLRSFLKQWNWVEQQESWVWDETLEQGNGRFSFTIRGVPLMVDGKGTLVAAEEGSLLALDLLAYCGVPFVGPTLARAAATMIRHNLEMELHYLAVQE